MTVSPGTYNITLQKRADYSVILEFKDSDGNAVNLYNAQVYASVWNMARTVNYADFETEYIDLSEGKVKIKLTNQQTENLPRQSVYDVLVVTADNTRDYYLEGTIDAKEGLTAP